MLHMKPILAWLGVLFALAAAVFCFLPREDSVRLLYATRGDQYDEAAYQDFRQSVLAGLYVTRAGLEDLGKRGLASFDAIYLDPALHGSKELERDKPMLLDYVRQGGHLFLENAFMDDFPADFLGASQIVDVQGSSNPAFAYPQVGGNLQGLQTVFHRFSDNFLKHAGMDSLPGFKWGKGMIPATAQPLVELDRTALYAVNRVGRGSVFVAGTFLPNRYFITGFDLKSGMDPSQGFAELAARQHEAYAHPTRNAAYFDRNQIPLEPYFSFTFASANALFRTEYVAYVSKEKLGYSMKKIFGPYGRPAMAYQNHFEAMSAIRDGEGIQWAELLKRYNQIPSFSLVRSTYDWGQWKESITVQLNAGTSAKPQFTGEFPNSFYSSGTHLISGGALLTLAPYPDYKSLGDPVELPYRAYPAIADLDGDGTPELLAGSADGRVYFFRDTGAPAADPPQQAPAGVKLPNAFAKAAPLATSAGAPLSAGAYAAAAALDVTGDGRPDLVLGGGDGALRLAVNAGGLRFAAPVPLADIAGAAIRVPSHAAPAFGDVDGDGTPDLIVGTADGRVFLYRGVADASGKGLRFAPGRELLRIPARYAAPSARDMNGDGRADLVIGNNEGNLLVYLQESGGGWRANGSVTGSTVNQLGNNEIVGGHNSVPLWYDINRDGKDDLVVGQLEFGTPWTIDDPNFPYRKELQAFIDYCKANHLELYPHLFFHNYVSDGQEKEEIRLHREAFARLGIPWNQPGANQHTWRINNPQRLQTLRNEAGAGIWFNFGFAPSYVPSQPQWGHDYLWGLPFLLDDGALPHPMVLYTPGQVYRPDGPYATGDLYESMVALDQPIEYFEHIEYHFPDRVDDLTQFASYLDHLRTAYDYNFMTEPQMARSFLTALTSRVRISQTWGEYLWNRVKDAVGKGTHFTRTIRADRSGVPEQAGEYADTLGVVIEPGEKLGVNPLRPDADIYLYRDNRLYTEVADKTRVGIDWGPEPMHIVRSNVPTSVRKSDKEWRIALNGAGMQQIRLYSPASLAIGGEDLKIEADPQNHSYTVTHFGGPVELTVKPESRPVPTP
jgi:hypothetical protein